MDDIYEEVGEERNKEHIDAREHHYAYPQVHENLMIPATNISNHDLVITTRELNADDLVIPATELVDDDLVNPTIELGDERKTTMINLVINISDVKIDTQFLANYDWFSMQKKNHINMILFTDKIQLE